MIIISYPFYINSLQRVFYAGIRAKVHRIVEANSEIHSVNQVARIGNIKYRLKNVYGRNIETFF